MSITTLARKRAIAPRPPRTLRAVAAFAVALALVPLAYLIHRGIDAGLDRMGEVLLRADIGSLILRSVGLAALVGLTSAIIGSFTAWVCECSDLRAASTWHVLTVAPLAVPSYVAAYAWISISGSFASFWGATLVLTGVCIPLVHLHVTSALRRLDPALEDVAMSLGWPPAKVALRLVMPQVKRAVASGALLAFLYTLADFGVVATMRLQVFTWVIHGAYKASFDPNRAAILALVVCGISVVFVMLELGVRGDGSSSRVGAGVARERMRYPLGKTRVPVILALVTIVSLALGMPVVRSAQWVLAGGSEVTIEEFTRALITGVGRGRSARHDHRRRSACMAGGQACNAIHRLRRAFGTGDAQPARHRRGDRLRVLGHASVGADLPTLADRRVGDDRTHVVVGGGHVAHCVRTTIIGAHTRRAVQWHERTASAHDRARAARPRRDLGSHCVGRHPHRQGTSDDLAATPQRSRNHDHPGLEVGCGLRRCIGRPVCACAHCALRSTNHAAGLP